MRIRSGLAALVVSAFGTFCAVLAPPAEAAQAGGIACATTLTCTAEQINAMPMPQRLGFVRVISANAAPGYAARWGAVEGVLEFFAERHLGKPGSWVSYVDAGDLEAIERGIALAEGRGTDTYGNPGSVLWAGYLLLLRSGDLTDRSAHDRAWGEAEQASIDDGVALAEHVHGLTPTAVERRFFEFTQFYRWALGHRPLLLDLYLGSAPVAPGRPPRQQKFLDWFTDVTKDVPARDGAALSYDFARFDPSSGVADLVAIFRAYAAYFTQSLAAPAQPHVTPSAASASLHSR